MRSGPADAPLSTYRLQLRPGFGFDEAVAVVPYLSRLGITHVYCSPYLQAAAGSTHGYDVVDHGRVNEELGGPDAHARLVDALQRHGMGQVVDVVPNHMAIGGPENRWWWDVLENGPSSVYASYFDVDWDPPEAKLRNTVLMPVLGDHYGRVLEAGELRLERAGGTFTVHYHDHLFPVAPRSLDDLLAEAAAASGSEELASLATALRHLPPSTATDRHSVSERHRDKEVLRRRLDELLSAEPRLAAAVDTEVGAVNDDPDSLDALLDRQNYRLAFWRTAGRELDYRRFFDINSLVGLRVEDEQVFHDSHELVLGWLRDGVADGLRIDHPDGLRDPRRYLGRLEEASGGAWVVVEKILEAEEELPATWPVAGTTGYDFLNHVTGLFVDPDGEAPLTELYAEVTGSDADWEQVVRDKKLLVLRDVLGADVSRLAALLMEVCEGHRRYRDYTRHDLTEALRELIAAFPVYRTFVVAETGEVSDADARHVDEAVRRAREARPDIDPLLFAFIGDLVLLRVTGEREGEFVMRFQQVTGPAMAKGVEDTAFYTFTRFVALNEVGGSPGRFGVTEEEFHAANHHAAVSWPRRMVTTSTHDTKRSEDVRARLVLLSEIPGRWADAVARWRRRNRRHLRHGWPEPNTEYLLYQTLVGAWPLPSERAVKYMEKAVKEAKAHTSWTDPHPDYDAAVVDFTEGVLADDGFVEDLDDFVAPLVAPGRVTALAQTLLRLTAPGVPDTYQGTELWDLSLVDPDNRRPVAYDAREKLVDELVTMTAKAALARSEEGLPKLLVVARALAVRNQRPDLLGPGASYEPVPAGGEHGHRVVAFCRGGGAVSVAPRLVLGLEGGWGDTEIELPDGEWRDVMTGSVQAGGRRPVDEVLASFPVGLLVRS